MKEALITLLKTFKYPVMLQGSLTPDEPYPEAFFTFWNSETPDGSHYDNRAISWIWSFDVNFYATDPVLVNTVLLEAKALLEASGWIVPGKGADITSDEPTHTGRGLEVYYIEKEAQNA